VEPYLKVIREKCSQALHILDRFHIVANMNKAWMRSALRKHTASGRRAATRS
jgi:transposase